MSVSATAYQYLVNVSNCYLYLLPVSGLISLSATCICCNVSIYYLYLLQCLSPRNLHPSCLAHILDYDLLPTRSLDHLGGKQGVKYC